jgi:CheY-like chemotaxis protein
LTILLIEDSPDDASLLQRSLQRGGFRDELNVVRTAEEAMQYLQGTAAYSDRARFPYPMFIILDLGLPGMGGLDFLNWLRQQTLLAPTPVIVLTSSPYASDVGKAYELGAKTFFTKPLAGADLDRILKLIVDYWSASRLPSGNKSREGPRV